MLLQLFVINSITLIRFENMYVRMRGAGLAYSTSIHYLCVCSQVGNENEG